MPRGAQEKSALPDPAVAGPAAVAASPAALVARALTKEELELAAGLEKVA